MNQELEDLMLEYLLRKRLSIQTINKPNMPIAPKRSRKIARGAIHNWSDQDFEKVAFLYKEGNTPQAIAHEMGLRTQQVIGAIAGMQGRNPKWNAPRLLVQS